MQATQATTEERAQELILPATQSGFDRLMALDRSFIGTYDYMGLAFFWSPEYKHDLRDATPAQRVNVHNDFLAFGLALDGVSDLHQELIDTCLGNFTIAE